MVKVIIVAIVAFLAVTLLLVALLLFAKAKLTSSGNVTIDINNDLLAVVDVDSHIARRSQFCLCKEQQRHQKEGYCKKGNDCNNNYFYHLLLLLLKVYN